MMHRTAEYGIAALHNEKGPMMRNCGKLPVAICEWQRVKDAVSHAESQNGLFKTASSLPPRCQNLPAGSTQRILPKHSYLHRSQCVGAKVNGRLVRWTFR